MFRAISLALVVFLAWSPAGRLAAVLLAGTLLLWWLLRPRPRKRRSAVAQNPRAVVSGRVVRYTQAGRWAIFGLWCSACGFVGEAARQRQAEWASREHLRLDHPERR